MIDAFESTVRQFPQRSFFRFIDAEGSETAYTYREARLFAAAMARCLRDHGVNPGDSVAVDLPNCPEFVLLLLGAAYGGFSLIILNNRLTDDEKSSRLMDLRMRSDMNVRMTVDAAKAKELQEESSVFLSGETAAYRTSASSSGRRRGSFLAHESVRETNVRTLKALGRAESGRDSLRRRGTMSRQDALESAMHVAEHGSRVFDNEATAIVMFTSGTTGRPKAVPLTWRNLRFSADAANKALCRPRDGMWQVALPLFHIGGLQAMVRSVANHTPFVLYAKFDASRVLKDAARYGVTHVSVVDKMLRDMCDSSNSTYLARYSCVLLGGAAANYDTLRRAKDLNANVYYSYGMTETASLIASTPVGDGFSGGLRLLEGYEARIVEPGADGFGRLAVRGTAVTRGYLNSLATRTADGFFLTGDTAALANGMLFVRERTDDMFVSGGENIYPAEICNKLLAVPGVTDAYVFGVADETWGRRPVAFVERDKRSSSALPRAAANRPRGNQVVSSAQFAAEVRAAVSSRLSKLYVPREIFALDEFPRLGIGKVNRAALQQAYEDRIEVKKVTVYRVCLPLVKPFVTPKETLRQRESLIIEVTDRLGRTGLSECVAFDTDWYLPETLDQDLEVIKKVLAPLVLHTSFIHPSQVNDLFLSFDRARAHPMACGAIEPALWDLYGKIVKQPLWKLIGGGSSSFTVGSRASVPSGAVIPVCSPSEAASAACQCASQGYKRVKLKVVPGSAYQCARAVRDALPNMAISLDANQSFTERNLDELRSLDRLNIEWIEEPLDPTRNTGTGMGDLFARLSNLQHRIGTTICLDESITHPRDLMRSLQFPNLNCYALKVGKLGGIQPTIEFVRMAKARGMKVWMGGMYDTGVSKRIHAAFETVSPVQGAGDIGATSRYFTYDITQPAYAVNAGMVSLNGSGSEYGIGCELNRPVLQRVLKETIEILP